MADDEKKSRTDSSDEESPPPLKKQKSSKTRRGLAGLINQSNLGNELEKCSEKYSLYSTNADTCQNNRNLREFLSQLESEVKEVKDSELLEIEDEHGLEVDSRTDVLIIDDDEDDVTVTDAVEENADCSMISEPSPIPVPNKNIKTKRSKKLQAALDVLDRVKNFVNTEEDNTLNTSLSEISPVSERNDILVKVLHKGKLFKYTMKRSDPFYRLKDFLCEKIDESASNIMLLLGDRTISSCDTPNTVQLQLTDIIDCHIHRSDSQSSQNDGRLETDYNDPDTINICIQSESRKSKINITAKLGEPLRYVFEKYAADRRVDVDCLKFKFDGDDVDPDLTPNDLDIESGDCIDALEGVLDSSEVITNSDVIVIC